MIDRPVASGASPPTAHFDMYPIGRLPINSAAVDLSADRSQRAEGYPLFGLKQVSPVHVERFVPVVIFGVRIILTGPRSPATDESLSCE